MGSEKFWTDGNLAQWDHLNNKLKTLIYYLFRIHINLYLEVFRVGVGWVFGW